MLICKRVVTGVAGTILMAAALAGCSGSEAADTGEVTAASDVVATQSIAEVLSGNKEVHDTTTDADESDVVDISLDGDTASSKGQGVDIDGSTVTITAAGTYRLSGTLTDGNVVVDAKDEVVRLVLDEADISSSGDAAIAAVQADRLVVILAEDSDNSLSDTDSYADDADVNAALFSDDDMTITGAGSLNVIGNGNDAIASKDGLVIDDGTITVEAADDGIRGKDYLVVDGGTISVTAGGDGLKADNEDDAGYVLVNDGAITVEASGDGVDAATDLLVAGGTVDVVSGGGNATPPSDDTSAKGLKSGVITVVESGTTSIDASDDALHSDGAVHLVGGDVELATGDDGVHAEGALVIDGGTVAVTSSVEGLEAADVIVNDGDISVVSGDDGLNAAGGTTESTGDAAAQGPGPGGGGPRRGESVGDFSVQITGGTLVLDADGDGLDSNGTATISGGTVVVNGPADGGNGALDVNGSFDVSGGTVIAAGSSGMVVSPSAESQQGWVSLTFDTTIGAGQVVQIADADDNVVATFTTSKPIGNVVYSSADITNGDQYTAYVGGTASSDDVGGLASSGELGSATASVTATAGEAAAGGMGGGEPQGGGMGGDTPPDGLPQQ